MTWDLGFLQLCWYGCTISWDVTLFCWVSSSWNFKGWKCPPNVRKHSPNNIVSHPRRMTSSRDHKMDTVSFKLAAPCMFPHNVLHILSSGSVCLCSVLLSTDVTSCFATLMCYQITAMGTFIANGLYPVWFRSILQRTVQRKIRNLLMSLP